MLRVELHLGKHVTSCHIAYSTGTPDDIITGAHGSHFQL